MSNIFVFIICIVAIALTAEVVKLYIEKKNTGAADIEGLDDALSKLDQLEERIQVLERIATESRPDLKKMIDDL